LKNKVIVIILSVILFFGLFLFNGCKSDDTRELEEKIAKLEKQLESVETAASTTSAATTAAETTSVAEVKKEEETTEITVPKTTESEEMAPETTTVITTSETLDAETQAAESGSNQDVKKDKIIISGSSLGNFSKFQALAFKRGLSIISDFNSASFSSSILAIIINPDSADITKLYDFANKGGKAVCLYNNWEPDPNLNNTLNQLLGISVSEEDLFDFRGNAISLKGSLFSNFSENLNLSFIYEDGLSIFLCGYLNDNSQDSIWHSEFTSEETGDNRYFSVLKNIGQGQVLIVPIIYSYENVIGDKIRPLTFLSDKLIDYGDNLVFADKIMDWASK
jgi:hypothetical protein